MKNLPFYHTKLKSGFWKFYQELDRREIVKNVYNRFAETGRFAALSCNWREGDPNRPHIFWDSDVVKWIEGAAYLLESEPCPELEQTVDRLVAEIEKNQRADGYFNSYFLSVAPSQIFTNRDWHELYCIGHMIEAAIAYDHATGKDQLLRCACRAVDLIERIFVREQSAAFVTPGHEEIELALLKLYEYLGNEKYLKLARFFIDQRGNNQREEGTRQIQADLPVRQACEAVGHAVRAGYLYTAMASLARIDGDEELKAACCRLYEDIVSGKMSITGGIGADHDGEKFSYRYDLPNRAVYNETCAAISLSMFAGAMQELEPNAAYGDVIERVWYNGFLSGVSLTGDRFFYSNPLEVDRKKAARSDYLPVFERVKVFECSCCPPNVVRMLASATRYMYTVDEDQIYCNQFASSETHLTIGGKEATLTQQTNYPIDGKILFTYHGEPCRLYVRIPGWCVEYEGETVNGFAPFDLCDGQTVSLDLPMKVHFLEANPCVQDDAGRYAVARGPIIYCMEELDNGENLRDITLLEQSDCQVVMEDKIPAPVIYMDAERRKPMPELYRLKNAERVSFRARLIPYFSFANREPSDMLIWTMVR